MPQVAHSTTDSAVCARTIRFYDGDEEGPSILATVRYDVRGRWIRYEEDRAVDGELDRLQERVFEGERLVASRDDYDNDGMPERASTIGYDDAARVAEERVDPSAGISTIRRTWDPSGRLVHVELDGTEEEYSWSPRLVVLTTREPGAIAYGTRYRLGDDGLVDAIELFRGEETQRTTRYRRDGARLLGETTASASGIDWIDRYEWSADRWVRHVHDDHGDGLIDAIVELEYDDAGHLVRRRYQSPTHDYLEATISLEWRGDVLLEVVMRDASNQAVWRRWRFDGCGTGFEEGIAGYPVGEHLLWIATRPDRELDLTHDDMLASPFD